MNVPDSRGTLEEFLARIAPVIGDDDVELWVNTFRDETPEYDFTYSSVDRAVCCAVGWRSWPLELECAWMLPRLRDALARRSDESQFLVEIGAGPGAAAAILSAALRVPVLSLDPHPMTNGLPEQLAEMTRGEVTSHVAGAEDMADVLAGRTPAAVFGLGVFRYFQPHHHRDDTFSYTNSINAFIRAAAPTDKSREFFRTIAPADFLLSEVACPDYVGEVAAGAYLAGYHVVDGGLTQLVAGVPGTPTENTLMHFSTDAMPQASGSLMQENYWPLRHPRAGLNVEGLAAEPLRLSLASAETLRLTEIRWNDGSGVLRREAFRYQNLFGHYTSTTRNYRAISFFSPATWEQAEREATDWERQTVAGANASAVALLLPVSQW